MLNKKFVIILSSIIFICGFYIFVNSAVVFYLTRDDTQAGIFRNSDIPNKPFSDDNLPEKIKKFCFYDEPEGLKYSYNSTSEFYNNKEPEKNINIEKEYRPSNYDEYCTELCRYVLNRIKQNKNIEIPTYKDYLGKPGSPRYKTARNTVRLWAHVSVLLDVEGKDKESLLIPYLAYYFSRDIEIEYFSGGTVITKLISCGMNGLAGKAIMRWSSKPRPNMEKLSKYLADDLLKLVDIEIPVSNCFEYEKNYPKHIFTKAKNSVLKVCNIGGYAEKRIDYFYDKAAKISSLPWLESKAELSKFKAECDECFLENLLDNDKQLAATINAFFKLAFSPRKFCVDLLLKSLWSYDLKNTIGSCEVKLAKMEMTAIALVYNSFYSAKKRVPNSIEELEKWYGKKLPKNRLNGKPYKLYEREGYVLYNNGLNDVYDPIDPSSYFNKSDDFFFIFNEK